MRFATLIHVLWCVLLVIGYAAATRDGYSPFAEGGSRGGTVFVHGSGGPHHK